MNEATEDEMNDKKEEYQVKRKKELEGMPFLLDRILAPNISEQEAIITILRARGFLIEEYDEKFYISDNADVDDVKYITAGFKTYDLGSVINNHDYEIRTRKDIILTYKGWPYSYEIIKPGSVEIVISNNAKRTSAIDFFHCMGRNGTEAGPCECSWSLFCFYELPPKAPVTWLESYIAFYVKAISACGVYTCYSCDGNHPGSRQWGRVFVDANPPYNYWHEAIWEYIIMPHFGSIPFIGKAKNYRFDEGNQRDTYYQLYMIANYLYDNRIEIREIKQKVSRNLGKDFKKKHTDQDIKALYLDECKRAIESSQISIQHAR